MKINNIKKLAIVAVSAVIVGTGCKTDFDINTSSEDLTAGVVNYRTILPSATATTARIVAADWKFLQNWMGHWARSGSYQNVADEETYSFTNDFPAAGGNGAGNPWNDLYFNLSNYNYVQQNAQLTGDGFYEAIARIMKAHNFQILTDVYGNVPYSEALKGNANRTPKYDSGADIYNDLFRQLDTAIALLKDPVASSPDRNVNIGTNDLIFKGNPALWVKFANTLKLRLIVHAFDATEIDKAAEVAIINAEGSGYLGAGETAKINPGYSGSKPNPFYRAYAFNENTVLSGLADQTKANEYAIGYYQFDGDPRLDKFYIAPDADPNPTVYDPLPHKGIPYGAVSGAIPNSNGVDLSSINQINAVQPNTGTTPNGASSDAWIFTSVESLFLQAEAAQRGLISADARSLYYAAVQESFATLGLSSDPNNPTSDLAVYLAFNATYPDVDFDAAPDPLFTILSQKWFALNNYAAYEIWTDFRRTDIVYGEDAGYNPGPPLSTLAGAATSIPVRLFYPQSEYNYNEVNVQAQGDIDVFTDRVFWDRL